MTGQTSVQSDIFAVGVTLYELLSGRHPFVRPEAEEFQIVRAIQFADPRPLTEVPAELASVIATCLQKTPSGRYSSAADLREALRTIMKTMQFETGILPGETATNLHVPAAEREKRATGFLSMLAERFRESADRAAEAEYDSRAAVPELRPDGRIPTVRLCAGGCHCRAAGAHVFAGGAAFEFADAVARAHAADGSVVGGKEAAGAVGAGGQFHAFGTRASI